MSLQSADPGIQAAATPPGGPHPHTMFGQGGHEPYAGSLARGMGRLTLRPVRPQAGPTSLGPAQPSGSPTTSPGHIGLVHFSMLDWSAPATPGELELLRTLRGPVLDVGCGPGRMLAAAKGLGLASMGIDTSAHAVRLANGRGGAAIQASIFDPVPHEGGWGSALLLDGNIGIGGNVRALLERVASLLAPGGQVVAEADPLDSLDLAYAAILEDSSGRCSDAFPWARVGAGSLAGYAARAGFSCISTSRFQRRVFLTMERRQ